MALMHNGALLCSQISQVFAVFAPRHVDPSSVSPIHQCLYLAPLQPSYPPPDKVLRGRDRWPSLSLLHNSSASFPESLASSGQPQPGHISHQRITI